MRCYLNGFFPLLPDKLQLEDQTGVLQQSVDSLGADVAALRSQVTALTHQAASFAEERDEWQAKYNSAQVGVCAGSIGINQFLYLKTNN